MDSPPIQSEVDITTACMYAVILLHVFCLIQKEAEMLPSRGEGTAILHGRIVAMRSRPRIHDGSMTSKNGQVSRY